MHMQQHLGQPRVSPQGRGGSGEPVAGRSAGGASGPQGAGASTGGIIMTTTGAYNIDYDAAYAARKQARDGAYPSQLDG